MNPECDGLSELQRDMAELADAKWGPKTLEMTLIKVLEELGEVARALVRLHEGREGDWKSNLDAEVIDLVITANNLAWLRGIDLGVALPAALAATRQKWFGRGAS